MTGPTNERPLRIAAYGFVAEGVGSSAGAYYELFRELLGRGHRIDFYAATEKWSPGTLGGHPNFAWQTVAHPVTRRAFDWMYRREHWPGVRQWYLGFPFFGNLLNVAEASRRVAAEHTRRPYDALVAFNTHLPVRVRGPLNVGMPQGPVLREMASWLRFGPPSPGVRGRLTQLLAVGFYLFKVAEAFAGGRAADVVVAGSPWAAEQWRRFGVPRRKLESLPYPLDLAKFPLSPRLPGTGPGFQFLHLGRIAPRKRVDLLLQAFAIVRQAEPAARLRLVGPEVIPGQIERWLADPDLGAGVTHSPGVPFAEVPALIESADAVVQPSEDETFGSAVSEGQACGRPVVVGPTNGTGAFIGRSSYRFREYTPGAVTEGMVEVMRRVRSDPAGVAADCRRAAEEWFDVRRVADRFEAILRRRGAV